MSNESETGKAPGVGCRTWTNQPPHDTSRNISLKARSRIQFHEGRRPATSSSSQQDNRWTTWQHCLGQKNSRKQVLWAKNILSRNLGLKRKRRTTQEEEWRKKSRGRGDECKSRQTKAEEEDWTTERRGNTKKGREDKKRVSNYINKLLRVLIILGGKPSVSWGISY